MYHQSSKFSRKALRNLQSLIPTNGSVKAVDHLEANVVCKGVSASQSDPHDTFHLLGSKEILKILEVFLDSFFSDSYA